MSSPTFAPCPSCGEPATGKFCSNCGAALAGAQCAACKAPLTPGAKFCHRCGTEVGATAPAAAESDRGWNTALPWAVAGIALVALIALVAGQRFGRSPSPSGGEAAAVATPAGARAVDISQMTPEQRAERLYDRVMSLSEQGKTDSVQFFAPMAMQSYSMLDSLSLDQRYDLGRIAIVAGEEPVARAQADTILQRRPTHLLGLLLAADAAKLRKDGTAERDFVRRFVAAEPTERARQLPEYTQHAYDINTRLTASGKSAAPRP